MIRTFIPAVIVALDGKIKAKREHDTQEKTYLDGNIEITTLRNKGMFASVGEKYPTLVMLSSLALTLLVAIKFLASLFDKSNKGLSIGLGLLLGGAISNTYDRASKNYVVDYLRFPKIKGLIRRLVFNLSDFAIFVGSIITAFKF